MRACVAGLLINPFTKQGHSRAVARGFRRVVWESLWPTDVESVTARSIDQGDRWICTRIRVLSPFVKLIFTSSDKNA